MREAELPGPGARRRRGAPEDGEPVRGRTCALRRWRRGTSRRPVLRRRVGPLCDPALTRRRASDLMAELQHLRVLIANERRDRLELLAQVVIGLGHDVIAREIYVKEVGPATARERPDVALVGLGESSEHALELISEIVREASCPVIALLARRRSRLHSRGGQARRLRLHRRRHPRGAAKRDRHHPAALRRVPEPARRIRPPRADRAGEGDPDGPPLDDADRAFETLRDHSQRNGRKLSDVAAAVVESHLLLLPPAAPQHSPSTDGGNPAVRQA